MKVLLALSLPLLVAAEMKPIFNGRDLEGWVHEGPRATFSAVNGELFTSGRGNYPNWLRTSEEYENFRLEFEYKLPEWGEAAVLLRVPRCERPGQAGLSIILAHDYHNVIDEYVTGAVAGVLPPREPLPPSFDTWHKVEILLDGDHLRVWIDGRTVQDAHLLGHPELRYRLLRGHIGFPDMGHRYWVRSIRLEDLGDRQKYVTLFDGATLKGWRLRGGGHWSVRGGAIVGANGHGILYAGPVFENFELTVEVLSRNRANGGIFLRGEPEGPRRGFEVQIYSPPDAVYPTGSIYGIRRSRISADYEGRWFLMQIRVDGARCLVRIDGETVAETERLPETWTGPGRIGLQIHTDGASVEFRNLRVRVL